MCQRYQFILVTITTHFSTCGLVYEYLDLNYFLVINNLIITCWDLKPKTVENSVCLLKKIIFQI